MFGTCKTDNHLGGRYLAELTKELLDDLEETKYQLAEYRLSIYGRKPTEWSRLAKWVIGHGLVSEYNRWMCAPPVPTLRAVAAQKSQPQTGSRVPCLSLTAFPALTSHALTLGLTMPDGWSVLL